MLQYYNIALLYCFLICLNHFELTPDYWCCCLLAVSPRLGRAQILKTMCSNTKICI